MQLGMVGERVEDVDRREGRFGSEAEDSKGEKVRGVRKVKVAGKGSERG